MNTQVFCPECRHFVDYEEKTRKTTATLKGETYEFTERVAVCSACGEELYVPELEDANLKALYDQFRWKHNIISLEHIQEIPKKYNIGKRPLSLLLGWGEQTFSRYLDGDMPTKEYSDTLRRIYVDPKYYLTVLEEGKSKLKSTSAYYKSKRAVETILQETKQNETKLDFAVDYLLSQCHDITNLALQKSLYYVQGFYYAFFGTFLFEENCEAWVHGPVYPEIYHKFSSYRYGEIDMVEEPQNAYMTAEEKAILDSIVKHICCFSGKTLEAFTHLEMPWVSTRGDLPADAPTDAIITQTLIGEYFTSVKEKFDMITPANINDYTLYMLQKI